MVCVVCVCVCVCVCTFAFALGGITGLIVLWGKRRMGVGVGAHDEFSELRVSDRVNQILDHTQDVKAREDRLR